MPTLQKVAMGVIGLAVIGTFLMKDSQTSNFFNGLTKLTTGTLSTAQGRSTGTSG